MQLLANPALEGVTGEYFEKKAQVYPSRLAQDAQVGARLWDESAKLTGLPA